MLTVIIKHDGEDNVIKLTYELLWRELKNIEGAQLLVSTNWFADLDKVKNKYVCFVESDCVVSSGYFESQLSLFQKNDASRRLAVLTSSTAVQVWAVRFFGYKLGNEYSDGLVPVLAKRSNSPYAIEIGYIPGAVMRMKMLERLLQTIPAEDLAMLDLVQMSTIISLGFWRQGAKVDDRHPHGQMGNMVYINPNATYVTTEGYVNDIGQFKVDGEDVKKALKGQI